MHKLFFTALLSASAAGVIVACSDHGATPTTASASQSHAQPGIKISDMDPSVTPGADFYHYANGHWQKSATIPADRARVGSFLVAAKKTEHNKEQLIAELLKTTPPQGSNDAKIVAFYNAYIDQDAIDAAGMEPVQAAIARYQAITSRHQLSAVLGANLRADVDPMNATDYNTENLFGLFVTQGATTPGKVQPYLLQGGLGLPDRAYYLSSSTKMEKLRQQYRHYIAKLLSEAGLSDAKARAERIFALEKKIASAHESREKSHDFSKSATAIWTQQDFNRKAPGLDWSAFFQAAQLAKQPQFIAYSANAIPKLSALVASEPLQSWQDWLIFHQINKHADVLPKAIDDAHFAFYGTTLNGVPQQRSRTKRALAALDHYLGDAVGKDYVARYFPASAKHTAENMVDNILDAYHQRINALTWMTPATKKEALAKLNTLVVGVGYPQQWQDYAGYKVDDNAYDNAVAGAKVHYQQQLAKIGKAQDQHEWWMEPQTVNALNLPLQNALNFPAAILQPPFFDAQADSAYNYGAIGAVIGHEISHSFDNNGAAFDSTGALRNWWTKADFAHFNAQGEALAKQFDQYAPFPDLHVNGHLTLGENIADLAGLAASYDAYHASLNGKPAPVINGLTGDQRFFISYAQTWATKMRPQALRQQLNTNEHAPGQYRALTVRNIDAWYQAFHVQPEQALYLQPEQRVTIW